VPPAVIHPSARGFAVGSKAYERGRPGYHPQAVAWLGERLGLGPERTVVDVAAGTGKLTRLLVATGADVVAVEPVAEMRARLAEAVPGVRAQAGTAEALPLRAASVDAVTVAQAFHWFDGPAALTEFARVLRPGGGLGLLWNVRDEGDPVQAAITEIIEPLRGDTPTHRTGAWRRAFDDDRRRFTPLVEHRVGYEQGPLDAEGLADRVASTSFIAALADGRRAEVLDRVRALVPPGRAVTVRYTTLAYRCRRR
jgi:ubiquinone/menaquinone biosynthesis C-methylase UbiE